MVGIAPRAANSSISELTSVQKGGKNENRRVASHEVYTITLEFLAPAGNEIYV